jgi:hypothetical protein
MGNGPLAEQAATSGQHHVQRISAWLVKAGAVYFAISALVLAITLWQKAFFRGEMSGPYWLLADTRSLSLMIGFLGFEGIIAGSAGFIGSFAGTIIDRQHRMLIAASLLVILASLAYLYVGLNATFYTFSEADSVSTGDRVYRLGVTRYNIPGSYSCRLFECDRSGFWCQPSYSVKAPSTSPTNEHSFTLDIGQQGVVILISGQPTTFEQ